MKYDDFTVLVFEDYFRDTLLLKVNGSIIAKEYIEADKSISRVHRDFKILRHAGKGCLIDIALINVDDRIGFNFKKRYRFLYIKRSKQGMWFVEYSNYKREYY